MTNPGPVPAGDMYTPVDEPVWPPRQQALYAAALLLDEPGYRPGWATGVTYPSDRCGQVGVWPAGFAAAPVGAAKTLGGPTWSVGRPIVVYGGFECRPDGEPDRGKRSAAAQLEHFEESKVETVFASGDAALGIGAWLATPDAVDLTPAAGPVSFVNALGTLEAELRVHYGGRGIIHAPSWMAPYYAARQQIREGRPTLQTFNGNRWSFGAYTGAGPATPAVSGFWVYATGAVVVRRGPVVTSDAFDPVNNLAMWLAERLLVISTECRVLAVNVDPDA